MSRIPRIANYRSYTTKVVVTIYRYGKDPLELNGHVEHGHLEHAPTVISCNTSKNISAPSGTFSLMLHAPHGFNMRKEIQSGDWVYIGWQRGEEYFHGTLGCIDGVRADTRINEGATSTLWSVNGRDMGKVFETAIVWFNDWVKFNSNIAGRIFGKRMGFNPTGTPDQVVANLIDAFFGVDENTGGRWKMPRGLDSYFGATFSQALKFIVQGTKSGNQRKELFFGVPTAKQERLDLLRGFISNEAGLFTPEPKTKIIDLLTRWSNPILNELFFDIEPLSRDVYRPAVFHRERPFINSLQGLDSPWFSLPTVVVDRTECAGGDLGSSDAERVNMFMLYARNDIMSQMEQWSLYPPFVDEDDAENYGLRIWERAIDFAGIGTNGTKDSWAQEIQRWAELLASWYGPNHLFLNGSQSFNFILGEARVGQRLIIQGAKEEDVVQAYIEGVNHNWKYPTGGSTSLSLTRGIQGNEEDAVQLVLEKVGKFNFSKKRGESFSLIPTGIA